MRRTCSPPSFSTSLNSVANNCSLFQTRKTTLRFPSVYNCLLELKEETVVTDSSTKAPHNNRHSSATPGSPETLCPIRYSDDVFMDPASNLIAVVYIVDEAVNIDLRTLGGDTVHPQAAGPKLILSGLPGCEENWGATLSAELKGFRGHVALRIQSLRVRV